MEPVFLLTMLVVPLLATLGMMKGVTEIFTSLDRDILITMIVSSFLWGVGVMMWGSEFGRTSYCQGKLDPVAFGRDHHPRCFTTWMAGGGVKAGHTHGETDEYSYNVINDSGVHVHDLHATILHQMGVDHERLTFNYQGRHVRLTAVHVHVVRDILS